MRAATPSEILHWDSLVAANPDGGHILHTRTWAEFKSAWNWHPEYLIDERHGRDGAPLAVLFLRRPIAGLGNLWYAPKGPGVASLDAFGELVGDVAGSAAGFLVKVEPELPSDRVTDEDLAATRLRRATEDVQIHGATIVVNLGPSDDALLASFKSKTRYNIRLAERRGVTVFHAPVDATTLDVMYRLMCATGTRAGFPVRRRAYFADYWSRQAAAGQGDLFFAMLGDEVLSGAFVQHFGRRAWYKDGGSTRRHSELMAPHLLQWEIMRWLRTRDVRSYDLVAVPRRAELNPAHPLWGLYRFKSGFSDHVEEYVGTLDLPLSEAKYTLWNRIGERAAAFYSTRVRRNLLY